MKKDLKLKCQKFSLVFKQLIFGIFLLATVVQAQAQSKVISGLVTDEQKIPIPGVSIVLKGQKTGTQSDMNGQFKIQASATDQLTLSFVGFETKTVTVGNAAVLNVVLSTSTIGLKDVVVTALGIKKSKRNLTYSTQTVEVEDLTRARDLNVANSLSGKVAGIDISRSSSGLGGSTRVTLRGDRSISGNNQALYVVDGIPIDNSGGGPESGAGAGATRGRDLGDGISSINSDDIESINVLKGASATALYGSRAANGAIIITTKKGSNRKGLGISYSVGFQADTPRILQEQQNIYGQGTSGAYNKASEQSWGPKMDGNQVPTWSVIPADAGKTLPFTAQPNNVKDFYTTGTNLVNTIALNGGVEKTQVYFSYTNTAATGIVDNNTLKRNNLNFRLGSQFGEKLSLDAKVTYLNEIINNRQRTGDAFDNVNRHVSRLPRNISLDDAKNYSYVDAGGFTRQNFWNPGSNGGSNPYWTKNNVKAVNERNRMMGFVALNYKILPELSLTLRSGLDKYVDDVELKWANNTYTIAEKGNYRVEQRDVMELNNDFLFNYDKKISEDFNISANFGGNIQQNKIISSFTDNGGLIIENFFTTGNAAAGTFDRSLFEREKQSLYATTDIGYKNLATLTLTGRNDWSSTLPKGNNSYFFSSAGITTIISDIFKMPSFINFAKIRASIAQTGNDADPYNLTQTYTSSVGGNGVIINRDGRLPISNLKPEITTSQEAGIDLRLFDNRLNVEFTWFNSNSRNQLLPVTLPAASGWSSEFINAGNVKNSGIELTLGGKIIKQSDFKWDMSVNYSKNTNEVIEISPTLNEFILGAGDFMNTVKVIKGKPYGELYSRGYTRNATGQIIVDANGLPIITSAQSVYLGNTRPDWTGSIMNKLSYKDVFFSFLIGARIGGVVSSFTNANTYGDGVAEGTLAGRDGFVFDGVFADGSANNKSITAEQYWTKVGGRNAPAGEVFTYSATNIRLREVVIGYNIPKELFGKTFFQNASISFSGRNLFFFKNNAKGFDPESVVGTANSSVGIEAFSAPSTRTYGATLNLSF
ncbi:SusC/RagA family TonB-linked outer membrane protein [Flavobacterium weaverense]|uniref:TonB-linked SusC/RagA family outer membrane protein n=1 Tax=Flavobacterium weaverense TaxID=271156 RepID=A0A3L9ZMT5_9FLAO|nr:SusC/RagA family TonB-linked outer membrane protein [Flavobacterium weaverense]RMA71638.1 TonB-linked SusC/RagA family outer membrane protein [Flavobacterium weaverense]